jgi:hypothetical protein
LNLRPLRPEHKGDAPQGTEKERLTEAGEAACVDACTRDPETGSIPAPSPHLAAIADLLANLTEDERRAVIADMAPADRVAVAKLLVAGLASGGGRPA